MLIAVWSLPRAAARGVRDFGPTAWAGIATATWRLFVFGIVPAIASSLELAGFAVLIALSTQLGDSTAHAFQIVFSIHNVTFSIALGLGSAAGVRTGNAVGEGQPAAAIPRALTAVAIAVVLTAILAVLLIVAAGPITALFPATTAVHAAALAMLPIWAPFILFDSAQVVLVYALRSLGDQVVAGVNSIIAYFIVTGGLGLWLVNSGWGAMGLVLASGIGMVAAASLSVRLAGLDPSRSSELTDLLRHFQLPIRLKNPIAEEALLEAVGRDKKFAGGSIRFVLLRSIGDAFLSDAVTIDHLRDAIQEIQP
jgi:MATE family multidrug resistance protein